MIGWNFPSNNNGPITGISDAGIETFKGSLFESLIREICQNSLDAIKDENKTVLVEFKKFKRSTCEIEGIEELKYVFTKCQDYWKEQQDGKAKNFFHKGLSILERNEIDILRISDFNTVGLDGSDKEINSNWSNLIKGSGVSDKGGNAGGSFGIGKSAAFACSDLRTVFYSTKDKSDNEAYQGVCRLASFKEDDYITQGIGYYGVKEFNNPIKTMIQLDTDFKRDETGTDIYLIGFNDDDEWKEKMIGALLDGFLVALWKGFLAVRIDNIYISQKNLNEIFEKYNDVISDNIKNYYEVLLNIKDPIRWNFNNLGNVSFYLFEKEDFCRKVYISRKSGMKIYEQNRFPRHIDFAGVLILEGNEVNAFFRKMESPQHDKWEPDRYDENPKLAEKYKRELICKLKELVNELDKYDSDEELEVEGLGDLITDIGSLIGDKDKKESITDNVTNINLKNISFDYKENKTLGINKNKGNDNYIDELGEFIDDAIGLAIKNQGGQSNDITGGGKVENGKENEFGDVNIKKPIRFIPINSRVICSNKNKNEYKYIFTLKEEIMNAYLLISIKGEQVVQGINVKNAYYINDKLKTVNNIIYLNNLKIKDKNSIIFTIDYDDYCSLEVDIYGFKE